MNKFSFEKVNVIGEAIHSLQTSQKSHLIGGGTNILDLMKESVVRPETLVDINGLDLKSVEWNEDHLEVGALVSNSDLAYHRLVEDSFPLLSKAVLAGASAQIRNMATVGGNILQRTRCYYFYDVGTPCNKRNPGSGCGAIYGRNRIHAILGHSQHCIAVHPSDMCVALAALDANVRVLGSKGERIIPFEEFHRLPGDKPHLDNTLSHGEMITHVLIPKERALPNFSYFKVRDRASYSFALVSVAVSMEVDHGMIKDVSVALGGVAHKPWRNRQLEESIQGLVSEEKTFEDFARHLLKDARGFADNSFKIDLARRAIVRAMKEASQRTIQ